MKKFLKKLKNNKGFALLFTVLVISIMLSIALGISDITFKQTILSSSARDSQAAFYQADSGVECGLYYDVNEGLFSRGPNNGSTDPSQVPSTLGCGNVTLVEDLADSHNNYFVYQPNNNSTSTACFSVTIDKGEPRKNVVSARGYSTCGTTPQQVERGLSVTY